MSTISKSGRVSQAVGIAFAATLGLAVIAPAEAEDTGFWDTVRAMERRFERVAPARLALHRTSPRLKYAARPKVQFARLPAEPKEAKQEAKHEAAVEAKPRDPDDRPNPLATLLADPTLRRGDIVMFPDGPRVFKGQAGSQHALLDFAKPSASRDVPSSARKLLAAMPVGENSAWSSDIGTAKSRIAQGADVETTGSLPRAKRSRH